MSNRINTTSAHLGALVVGAGAIALILSFIPLASQQAHATPGPIATTGRVAIHSLPYVVDSCGSYYVSGCLSGDEGSNGITIAADDVTLDLAGNTLTGIRGALAGIAVEPGVQNVHIFGGSLRDWNAGGVNASEATLVSLEDLRAIDNNGDGLSVGDASRVRDCTAMGNRGRGIVAGPSSRVADCSVLNNQADGLVAEEGSIVSGAIANHNDGNGLEVTGFLSASTAFENEGDGVSLGNGGSAYQCTIIDNRGHGLRAGDECSIQDCSVSTGGPGGTVGYKLGSYCYLGGSRGKGQVGERAVRFDGDRSFVERCCFTKDGGNSGPLADWVGTRNFVGDCLITGFQTFIDGSNTTNAYGQPSNNGTGQTGNFSQFGNIFMFF